VIAKATPQKDLKIITKEIGGMEMRSASLLIYGKDITNTSHDSYSTLREIGKLEKILPSRTEVSKKQVEVNNIIQKEWGLSANYPESAVLSNVGAML